MYELNYDILWRDNVHLSGNRDITEVDPGEFSRP